MPSLLLAYSAIGLAAITDAGDLHSFFATIDVATINELRGLTSYQMITDSSIVEERLQDNGINIQLEMDNTTLKQVRLDKYNFLFSRLGMVNDWQEYRQKLRQKAIEEVSADLRKVASGRDELVAQMIHAIDDLQKSANTYSNRLEELYGLHFPELVTTIRNPVTLAKIIIATDTRESITRELLSSYNLPSEKIDYILTTIDSSIGGNFDTTNLQPIRGYASNYLSQVEEKDRLEEWVETEMSQIAPNLTALGGANVGARLIAAMGSLRSLALKSSSKIQVIGAEKALYQAFRKKGKIPKHGLIFQIPEIGNSPFWIRGKMARAYAAKLAIAARLDYFGGEFLGEAYREQMRALEQKLRQQFPNAPVREKRSSPKVHPAVKRRNRRKKR